jgi:predicted transcriptional regulator
MRATQAASNICGCNRRRTDSFIRQLVPSISKISPSITCKTNKNSLFLDSNTQLFMVQRGNSTMRSLTVRLVAAFLQGNSLPVAELGGFIASVHQALRTAGRPDDSKTAILLPAVARERSVTPDAIVCLDCGRTFATLRRHIDRAHGLSPATYRHKWRLAADYPITAPNYSVRRSELVRITGFGKRPLLV